MRGLRRLGKAKPWGVYDTARAAARWVVALLLLPIIVPVPIIDAAATECYLATPTDHSADPQSQMAICIPDKRDSRITGIGIICHRYPGETLGAFVFSDIALKTAATSNTVNVKYRFDKGRVIESTWNLDNVNAATAKMPEALEFASGLSKSQHVALVVGDQNAAIDVGEYHEGFEKVIGSCGLVPK
jgi:hypothetical protein